MEPRQERHGFEVAVRDGAVLPDEGLRAEVLDDRDAVFGVRRVDFRGRDALAAQRGVHGEEGPDVAGEPGDLVVGLAEAHDRRVGAGRRGHEQGGAASRVRQALVGAGRGVAGQEGARGLGEARGVQQRFLRLGLGDARREGAVARHRGGAGRVRVRGVDRQRHVQPVSREGVADALGPFDEQQRPVGRLVPAELGQFGGRADAVKVRVDDGEGRRLVELHQREGGARHFELGLTGEVAHQRAREGRLADAEVARQGEEVAGAEEVGDAGGEERRVVGGRQGHRPHRLRCRLTGQDRGTPGMPPRGCPTARHYTRPPCWTIMVNGG